MNANESIFYLKVNRPEGYTLRNLWVWIDVVYEYENVSDWFIVCDNPELKQRIINEFSTRYPEIAEHFMECIINDEATFIVSHIADKTWTMAGYAHLTTFIHAKEKHYGRFWNIDADDTRFCLCAKRIVELLKTAEKYANNNQIDGFSLDMHTSRIGSGRHWSFGVTYINNEKDWMTIMKNCCQEDLAIEDLESSIKYVTYNIDRFFRYIRNQTNEVRLESFYIENLRFIHYSNDFFWRLCQSAFYHWKDGYLMFPILYYVVGLKNKLSYMHIDKIAVKLDINITDEESTISILKNSNSPTLYLQDIGMEEFIRNI